MFVFFWRYSARHQSNNLLGFDWNYRSQQTGAVLFHTQPSGRVVGVRILSATQRGQVSACRCQALVAFAPAVIAGVFLADYVTSVLYESPKVFATTFILGGIVMLLVEKFRPVPTVLDADRTPLTRALLLILDKSGNPKGRMVVSNDGHGIVDVFGINKVPIVQLTNTQSGGGKLWIGNADGKGMVEAGDAGGYGIVRAGPDGFQFIPTPGLALPGSVIVGKR